jgi:cytoplasmic iron level regulating protein YaaA (DUF328/UPF0246 family)
MVFYLLPGSEILSKSCTLKGNIRELMRKGKVSFGELNDLREKILDAFQTEEDCLSPAWRRFRGRFWEELCTWALPEKIRKEIEERGITLSPLFGLLRAGDPLPFYGVKWSDLLGSRTLREIWKGKAEPILRDLLGNSLVFDFLRRSDKEVISIPSTTRRVVFKYFKKDKPVINSLPHRAYTLRYILEMGTGVEDLERINFLDYRVEEVSQKEGLIEVLLRSEGRYL